MGDEITTANSPLTHQIVPIPFQVICITLSLIWFAIIINERLKVFSPLEKGAQIIQITPPVYQNFGASANFATAGLYIERFSTFDMVNNVFVFSGYVSFKVAPNIISLESLGKFSFEQGDILEQSAPETQIVDGDLLVVFRIKVRFSSLLNYEYFPFDDHKLRITLTHNGLSPEDIIFESSEQDLIVKTDVANYGWHQLNQVVEPGYIESGLDTYDARHTQYHPAITFAIDYERYGVRFILLIILPLLLILYVSLLGFSLDESTAVRNAGGSVTGILGYRYVIDTLSPKVGYFMIADYVFFMILTIAVILLAIYILTSYQITISMRAKKYMIVAIHLMINTISTYFFFAS